MKKRRILLALIMLIITGISLTTATYAWFTANQRVKVQEIDVKATASGGIQISADAKTWSNEVRLDDLRAQTGANYIPEGPLTPVTTIGVNTDPGAFKFFVGTLDGSGNNVSLADTTDDSNQYASFDIYFYSAQAQDVYFDTGTQVIAKAVDGPLKDAKLRSSVRVGFLNQGNDPTAKQDTAKGLHGGTKDAQKIWEPNANEHTEFATTQKGASGLMTYMGGKAHTQEASAEAVYVPLTDSSTFVDVTSSEHHLMTSDAGAFPAELLWHFEAGINKIRVYVWLEGQDIDNEDTATLGSGVGVTLKFRTGTVENA